MRSTSLPTRVVLRPRLRSSSALTTDRYRWCGLRGRPVRPSFFRTLSITRKSFAWATVTCARSISASVARMAAGRPRRSTRCATCRRFSFRLAISDASLPCDTASFRTARPRNRSPARAQTRTGREHGRADSRAGSSGQRSPAAHFDGVAGHIYARSRHLTLDVAPLLAELLPQRLLRIGFQNGFALLNHAKVLFIHSQALEICPKIHTARGDRKSRFSYGETAENCFDR